MIVELDTPEAGGEAKALPSVVQSSPVRRVQRDGAIIERIEVLAQESPVALV